mgnify:FL=1
MYQKFFENYCIIFFSIIPITILIGSSASLLNIIMICLLGLVNLIFIYKQGYNLFKSKPVKLILFLYIYLIFNSFIALDFETSAMRNFGFLRYLIFFITCNYFFFISKKSEKIFSFWLIIILIVIFDVFLESISGRNMLGYGELYGKRIVSFFKTEPVVGFYIYSFFLSLLGFLFKKYKNYNDYKKVLIVLFSIIGFISILLTGERSNTIKCLIGVICFYFINDNFSYKKKFYLLC